MWQEAAIRPRSVAYAGASPGAPDGGSADAPALVKILLIHAAADGAWARSLAVELGGVCLAANPAAMVVPRPRTIHGIAARIVHDAVGIGPADRLVLVGIGRIGGAVARAVAADLLGRDRPVAAVLLLDGVPGADLVHEAGGDLAVMAWFEPLIVWNQKEDARRIKSFLAETLADGADWLRARLAETVAAAETDAAAPTLLTLRLGRGEGGQAFCIPGAGASVVSFLDLAAAAPAGLAVHGLQPRGLDGMETPFATAQMAACALERQVLAQAMDRPVHLVGHSFGGCVAFDLACRLRARGWPPASVTLIDTRPPNDSPWSEEVDDVEVALSWIRLNEQAVERSLGVDERDLRRGDLFHNLALMHGGMVRVGLLPAKTRPAVLLGPMRMFAACVRSWYHTTEHYPAPLRLVHLANPALDLAGNAQAAAAMRSGWGRLAPAATFCRGSGNHITGLKMPNATRLAELVGWNGDAC